MHCRTYRPRRAQSFSFAPLSYCKSGKKKKTISKIIENKSGSFSNKEKDIVLKLTDQFIANFRYRICNLNSSVSSSASSDPKDSLQYIKNYRNSYFYLLKLTPLNGNKGWKRQNKYETKLQAMWLQIIDGHKVRHICSAQN